MFKGVSRELLRIYRLDQIRKLRERLLPPEITHLEADCSRNAFLHDVQLGSTRNAPKGHCRLHLSGQIRVVELIRVTNALIRYQLAILATERMTAAGCEVGDGH